MRKSWGHFFRGELVARGGRAVVASYHLHSPEISIVLFFLCAVFLIAAVDRNSYEALAWGGAFVVLLGVHAAIRVVLHSGKQ